MSRAGNDREYLRTINMNHTIYTLTEDGEFTTFSDNDFYKQKTLAEVIGFEHTRRYSSKYDDKKRKRNIKETRSKGRCNNKNYKLSESRFRKNGGNRSNG